MSYRGLLIREPELRWPIVILAAVITTIIALVAAGLHYVAMTQSVNFYSGPRLSTALDRKNRSSNRFANNLKELNERTVMVFPARQTALEPVEAIGVRVLH